MALSPDSNLHSLLAAARARAGDRQFKKARAAYRQALKRSPNHPEILSELGSVEAECGNISVARQLLRQAARISPGIAAIHFNLGELERQAERYADAEASYRRSLSMDPNDPDALFGLGSVLLLQARPEEARTCLLRAHALAPKDPEILNELGNASSVLKDFSGAIQHYRKALGLRPAYPDCWLNLALCHFDLNRFADANQAFDQAARLGEIPTPMLWKRAQVQTQCGLYEAALASAEASLERAPGIAQGYYIKGVIDQYHGRFDDAERLFRRTLELSPTLGDVYEKLALIKRLTIDDTGAIEALLDADADIGDVNRAGAAFALYRLYDASGERAKAFAALAEANRIKRRANPFNRDAHVAHMRAMAEVYTNRFMQERAGQGCSSTTPVFILGMPRSGTTLIEQILAASPDVFPGGEQTVFRDFIARLPGYPHSVIDKDADWVTGLAGDLLQKLTVGASGSRFVTDKAPSNYANIGLIKWLFPNAAIIYCRRDPMDVAFSSYEQNFQSGLSYCYDPDDFACAWREHVRLMAHWETLFPGGIFTMNYEELIANPAIEAKKLVEFCGLEWDDDFLDTTRVDRPIQTASFWQARQPINASSIGKWRRYEDYLSPFVKALGLQ